MVILGLLAAVSMPFFAKIRRRSELRGAAMEIGTTLIAARMKAVRLNANTRVSFNPASGPSDPGHVIDTFATTPMPATTPTPYPDVLKELVIPNRALRFVTTPPGGVIEFDGAGRRSFPPAPTPGSFVIEGPNAPGYVNQITIEISDSGRVRIVTPTVWQ